MKKKRMKRLVSIILALFTLAALLPISTISVKAKGNVTDIFSDVKEGAWYVSAIQYVYDNGIMVGTGSAFGVNNSLKREQFAATLYSMAGKPVVADDTPIPFSDVSNKTGYPRDAILWAVENGIAAGNADGTFGVGKSIQRQAVASMLYKYAQLCGFDLTTDEKALSDFCDADKVQSWATTSMKWAVTQDIISGKGGKRLDPAGVASRAECASMIKKLLTKNPEVFSLDENSATLTVGSELQLQPIFIPKIKKDKSITWSSTNPGVASVENGLVKAKSAGTTTITAKTADNKTATCQITVIVIYPEAIYLDTVETTLAISEKIRLTATITPDNATEKDITWSSSNQEVAIVKNGVVEAVNIGVATISAKTVNGIEATCLVTVKPNYKAGDIITFGKFEQDGDTTNGKEDIEWQILEVEKDRILVVSKYALHCMPYNTEWNYRLWSQSSLRSWLNSEFVNESFTLDEWSSIPTTTVQNQGQPDTDDQVFLLSLEDAKKYFGEYQAYKTNMGHTYYFNQNLICSPTQYAINNGATCTEITQYILDERPFYSSDILGMTGTMWWLRDDDGTGYIHYVSEIGIHGDNTSDVRGRGKEGIPAVRPAMYIEY